MDNCVDRYKTVHTRITLSNNQDFLTTMKMKTTFKNHHHITRRCKAGK